jgi:hypothetical protein
MVLYPPEQRPCHLFYRRIRRCAGSRIVSRWIGRERDWLPVAGRKWQRGKLRHAFHCDRIIETKSLVLTKVYF